MALTLEADQRLELAGLGKFFEDDKAAWIGMAKETKQFISEHFPEGAKIRRDDVSKGTHPAFRSS